MVENSALVLEHILFYRVDCVFSIGRELVAARTATNRENIVISHQVQECKGRPVANTNVLPAPHQKVPVSPGRHPVGQDVSGGGGGSR